MDERSPIDFRWEKQMRVEILSGIGWAAERGILPRMRIWAWFPDNLVGGGGGEGWGLDNGSQAMGPPKQRRTETWS
jgi:hypothetical protein